MEEDVARCTAMLPWVDAFSPLAGRENLVLLALISVWELFRSAALAHGQDQVALLQFIVVECARSVVEHTLWWDCATRSFRF